MSRISGFGSFLLTVFLLIVFTCAGWLIYSQLRARRLGLPPPTLASYNPFGHKNDFRGPNPAYGGVLGWVRDRVRIFKHRKTHSTVGVYDEPLNNTHNRTRSHNFSPLDPDDAWDTRVEAETDAYGPREYYEEPEFARQPFSYTAPDYEESRGRSRVRESERHSNISHQSLEIRNDQEMGRAVNPFRDAAELQDTSLKKISS